jgi:hypothetical protein
MNSGTAEGSRSRARRAAAPSSAFRTLPVLIAAAGTAAHNQRFTNLQNRCCTGKNEQNVSVSCIVVYFIHMQCTNTKSRFLSIYAGVGKGKYELTHGKILSWEDQQNCVF